MQQSNKLNQWLITDQDTNIYTWIEAFLFDRKAQGFSSGTLYFYQAKLKLFMKYCDSQAITKILEITPNIIREYLVYLEQKGHNPGGIHACYRVDKTFLYWWENEIEPEGWKNPIRKVKAPKLSNEPLKPVDLDTIIKLLCTCEGSFTDKRDRGILLLLLDTGVRAGELCSMNLNDIDRLLSSIVVREGKGGKPRTVFVGKKTRRALRKYFKARRDDNPALWVTTKGSRLSYWGLREIIRRRVKRANVPTPKVHDFRRALALEWLRNDVDIYSLQKLMGHADLQVLRRYLAQTTEDIQEAHRKASPGDKSIL
jgi:site-specific recombinase XerD